MSWNKKHLLEIDSFSRADIYDIFTLAQTLEPYSGIDKSQRRLRTGICHGDLMKLWFEPGRENSTRTYGSFPTAMVRMGGDYMAFDETTSSMTKGETVEDTTGILSGQSDLIVDRHRNPDHVYRVAKRSSVPVINAGNGSYQHPTQTLLDLYTTEKIRGRIDGVVILAIGDMKNGRTAHSFIRGLEKYEDVSVVGVVPEGLEMPLDFRSGFYEEHVIDMTELGDYMKKIKPDFIYATRIQEERMPDEMGQSARRRQLERCRYVITPEMLGGLPSYLMHPLPRAGEIDPRLDDDRRALYFRQADYGVPIRMAIIGTLLGYEAEIAGLGESYGKIH